MIENWNFLGLIILILLTPGPTNTLLATSGVQAGYRKSLLLIPAEALGYIFSISLWGFALKEILHEFPALLSILKLVAAVYIIGLSIMLWNTAHIQKQSKITNITYKTLFTITVLNPKAFIFAVTIFPLSTWLNVHNYLLVMATFLTLLVPIVNIWILLGHILSKGKIKGLSNSILQRSAAILLLILCMPLLFNALNTLLAKQI